MMSVRKEKTVEHVDDGETDRNGKTANARGDRASISLSNVVANYLNVSFGLAVWFLFVFCGGVVFAVYYARIGYLPDIELNSALVYLAAASIIGGSLILLLTFLLIVPGSIWAYYLTRDPSLKNAFCDGRFIIPGKFFMRLIFWFFLFALVAHVILIFRHWWLFLLFIPVALFKALYIWKVEIRDCVKDASVQRRWQIFFSYALRYGISVASGLIAIFALFKLLALSETGRVMEHLVICTVGVVIGNSAVAVFLHQRRRVGALMSAIVFALALLAATDRFDPLPNKMLLTYGFGLEHVEIIINEDTYKALRAGGIVTGDDTGPGPRAIADVQILCRMGSNYFLKIGNHKMTLAKSSVISWSVSQDR